MLIPTVSRVEGPVFGNYRMFVTGHGLVLIDSIDGYFEPAFTTIPGRVDIDNFIMGG